MVNSRWWVVIAVGLGACGPTEAPTELSDLSRFLYKVWDDDDARVRASGMLNLDTFLRGVDLASDKTDDRGWGIEILTEEDVATIKRPDRPLENCFGVALGFQSRWPAMDHAKLQILADQTPAEPSAPFYDRMFTDPSDPACFPDASCNRIDTSNRMKRKNALYSVESTLFKNFRWVEYEDTDGEPHTAFYSRSWYDQSWPGDKEQTMVWQSYSIDVWIDRGDGTAWRYQTLWNETDVGFPVSDELAAATVRGATEEAFMDGDAAIGRVFHDEAE